MSRRLTLFYLACISPANILLAQATQPAPVDSAIERTNVQPNIPPTRAGRASADGRGLSVGEFIPAEQIAQQVSVVIQVDIARNPYASHGNENMGVANVATSTAVVNSAAKTALELSPVERNKLIYVLATTGTTSQTRLEITLRADASRKWPDDAADRMLKAWCEAIKAAYVESAESTLRVQRERDGAVAKQLSELSEELAKVRQELRAGRVGRLQVYSPGDVEQQIAMLKEQKRSQERQRRQMAAQLNALQPEADPGITAWQELVTTRQQQVKELEAAKTAGTDVAAALTEANTKLTEATAQLATAKASAAERARENRRQGRSGDIDSLREQIEQYNEQIAQYDEQLRALEDPAMREKLERLPELRERENQLNSRLSNLRNQVAHNRDSFSVPSVVRITVLDGVPD